MIALDGEFVGVGSDGNDDALARISVVDFDESVLYDRYVQVEEQVIDFRTPYSGIHPVHLRQQNTVSFREAQQAVARLAQGRILVGHELRKDLRVLLLSHPHRLIRDTARYRPLRCRLGEAGGRTPSLRRLAEKLLGQTIQQGNDKGPGHDSVEDAITALRIYKLVAKDWERDAKQQDFHGKKRAKRYRQTLITSRGHRTSALKESTPEHSLRQNRQT
jgi:RNA exonuclease 4